MAEAVEKAQMKFKSKRGSIILARPKNWGGGGGGALTALTAILTEIGVKALQLQAGHGCIHHDEKGGFLPKRGHAHLGAIALCLKETAHDGCILVATQHTLYDMRGAAILLLLRPANLPLQVFQLPLKPKTQISCQLMLLIVCALDR